MVSTRTALALGVVLAGCSREEPAARPVEVTVHGELRALMHGGDPGGVVALDDVAKPGAVAVGALAGLRGEVTILDGAVHTSSVVGGEIAPGTERDAALLVIAHVGAWREVRIGADVAASELDAGIEAALRGAGVDASRPVPFVLEGDFPVLAWHVVDGPHTHGAPSGIVRDTPGPAVVVGFYSSAHEGVFTHMGQRTHLHVIVGGTTGHVDDLAIKAGTELRVPR
jgi:acetolactate decarboxylase